MKKALLIIATLAIAGVGIADIQSPPGDRHSPVRKLSRALSNIVYGAMEIPVQFESTLRKEGGTEAFSYGIVKGIDRTGARLGYGLFELVNFRTPKHKESFRAPYASDKYDSVNGYTEYPPQFGFTSGEDYVRRQSY
ncbi:MAG: putative exosortase-associated protein (TIGR04073 family) [Verrucomicrobiales bacterium]|jgi:putative exosortase-associated protein (TIGR04073 family)